jgi:glutamate-1-semialdehyde 2,1-aminomutase
VIVEPMLAASGCIPGERSFLEQIRRSTSDHGSILIFDEVMTSRLSPGGAQFLLGIRPDITTLGKYLAGGLPFGAFGGSRELMAVFDPQSGGTLTHGGTFNNDELSLAAGIAAVGALLDDSELEALNGRGDRLRSGLNEVFADAGVPMCATGLGSLLTIHGTAGPVARISDLDDSDDRLRELLFLDLLAAGFYMARRGFIALSLDITDQHVDDLLNEVSGWADGLRERIG